MDLNRPVGIALIFILALVGVAAFLLITGYRRRSLRQLIHHTPTVPIASLQPGFTEVKGQVVSKNPHLRSPYSNLPCAWYELRVDERLKVGKGDTWVSRVKDRAAGDVFLHDGTGEVEVNLSEAQLHLAHDFKGTGKLFERNDEQLRQILWDKYGFNAKGMLFEKELRFVEHVLEHDDPLYVLGTAERQPGGGWQLVKGDRGLLLVSDLPEQTLASNIAESGKLRLASGAGALLLAVLAWLLQG